MRSSSSPSYGESMSKTNCRPTVEYVNGREPTAEETAFAKRLVSVLRTMPQHLSLFGASGTLVIYRNDENDRPSGTLRRLFSFTGVFCDGGDPDSEA